MRSAGFVLFLVGIAIATSFAARAVPAETFAASAPTAGQRISAWWAVAGWPFVLGLGLVFSGGLLARRRAPAKDAARVVAGRDPAALLEALGARLDSIPSDVSPENAESAKSALDEILEELVPELLQARQDLIDRFGLVRYAEGVSQLAAFERNTARAWSALVDEAWAEIPPCLERAKRGLERARKVLAG